MKLQNANSLLWAGLLCRDGSCAPTTSSNRVVNLEGYGKFKGTVVNQTYTEQELPAPVDAWLGMDYATQPVGDGRFRHVTWPAAFNGTKNADEYGSACVQLESSAAIDIQDEACLNFNVYRTQGVPMGKKLPVLVWIHGGGFQAGSWQSFDGASFASWSEEPIVVVSFHYRVNSLGFLPSTLMEEEGLLNLGLLDQHLFLQFVQKHIDSFGGDPDRVTIGGRSAGGHSVGIHYFHNYDADAGKPLFSQAIHQSGSVTARTFPDSSYPLYADQMSQFMSYISCPENVTNAEALACLRAAPIDDIREISASLYEKYNLNVTWPFQPTLGGPLLEHPGSVSGIQGTFHHLPVITTNVNDEGKLYLPGNFTTNDEFLGYMSNGSPGLTQQDLAELAALYPDPATHPNSPYANSPNSTQYNRLSAAWSDYGYICPGQETAFRASEAGVPTWKVRFDVPDGTPDWQGIPHTSDTAYTWVEPTSEFPEVGKWYHAYLASFVTTGDPNTARWEGSAEWPRYREIDGQPAKQLAIEKDGPKVEKDAIRRKQCSWWRDPQRMLRLYK